MRSIFSQRVFLLIALPVLLLSVHGQSEIKWQRVTTSESFSVDVDPTSFVYEPERVVSARFRTVLVKPEPLENDPRKSYKTRIETMHFRLSDGAYRSSDISLLDSKDNALVTRAASADWKPARPSSRTWLAAARSMNPRTWKVVGYAQLTSQDDASDMKGIVGSTVYLDLTETSMGKKHCLAPVYESRKFATSDLEKLLDVNVQSLGLEAGALDVIVMKCERGDWQAGQTLLIKRGDNALMMLWEGRYLSLAYDGPKTISIPFTIHDVRDKSVTIESPNLIRKNP